MHFRISTGKSQLLSLRILLTYKMPLRKTCAKQNVTFGERGRERKREREKERKREREKERKREREKERKREREKERKREEREKERKREREKERKREREKERKREREREKKRESKSISELERERETAENKKIKGNEEIDSSNMLDPVRLMSGCFSRALSLNENAREALNGGRPIKSMGVWVPTLPPGLLVFK